MAVIVDRKTVAIVRCDCGKCEETISWVEEEVKKDPSALPEAAARILSVARMFPLDENDPGQYTFFSKACLMDWLKDYVPSKTPKAKTEESVTEQPKQAQPESNLAGDGSDK